MQSLKVKKKDIISAVTSFLKRMKELSLPIFLVPSLILRCSFSGIYIGVYVRDCSEGDWETYE